MPSFFVKASLVTCFSAFFLSAGGVTAGEPVGFNTTNTVSPQGFDAPTVMSVATLKANAKDKAIVTLEGRFVERLEKDKFLFKDLAGDSITAELDDEKDWSHVVKDRPMTITVEVDRDWNSVEIEVIEAK